MGGILTEHRRILILLLAHISLKKLCLPTPAWQLAKMSQAQGQAAGGSWQQWCVNHMHDVGGEMRGLVLGSVFLLTCRLIPHLYYVTRRSELRVRTSTLLPLSVKSLVVPPRVRLSRARTSVFLVFRSHHSSQLLTGHLCGLRPFCNPRLSGSQLRSWGNPFTLTFLLGHSFFF